LRSWKEEEQQREQNSNENGNKQKTPRKSFEDIWSDENKSPATESSNRLILFGAQEEDNG
jgi:hypothetical protein